MESSTVIMMTVAGGIPGVLSGQAAYDGIGLIEAPEIIRFHAAGTVHVPQAGVGNCQAMGLTSGTVAGARPLSPLRCALCRLLHRLGYCIS